MLALPAWHPSQAQSVQVYRCTAADGSVALQDSPCSKNAEQQVRTLKRPPEASPAPLPPETAAEPPPETNAPAPPPPPESEPEPAPPSKVYECITHDGQRYQNETGIGEMHWVPLWVIGMDPKAPTRTGAKAPPPPRSQPRAPDKAPDSAAPGAGTWIRDTCYELSPDKVCEHRRARLDELRRKRRQVTASERIALDAESTRLSEQYATQCP